MAVEAEKWDVVPPKADDGLGGSKVGDEAGPFLSKATRVLVLAMILLTEMVVNILAAAMVPYFPDFAMKNFGASSTLVGMAFALYPLSLFITSLFAGALSTRIGRLPVYTIGLIFLGGGTVAFGFSRSMAEILASRVIQGIGGGCLQVAGMSLILMVSDNIERDVGLDQTAIGLGFIVGPPLGGGLFSAVGFTWMSVLLGALPLLELLAIPFVAGLLKGTPAVNKAPTKPGALRAMATAPVIFVGLTSFAAFSSLALLEPFVESHLKRALGASVEAVGAIFMIPCVVFTIVSLFTAQYTKALGYRRCIAVGIALMALALLCMGPAPFLLQLPWSRGLSWAVQMVGFVLFGVGFAFVVTVVVPLMNAYLPWAGPEKEDFISSLSSACGSLGEFTGPMLGGFLAGYLPQRREASCVESASIPDCRTGASWCTFTFAIVLAVALIGFCLLTPEPPKDVDSKDESASIPDCRTGASWCTFTFAILLAVALIGFCLLTPEPPKDVDSKDAAGAIEEQKVNFVDVEMGQ